MSLGGQWEGKLIDATGVNGIVKLSLSESRGKLSGDYSVYFLAEGSGGCCGPERQLVQSGSLDGKFDAKNRSVHIEYGLKVGGNDARVSLDGLLQAAMPHARQAIFGCYDVDGAKAGLTLEGGGIVLWQYA